jgi:HPt (histidine-containing phosphotransfer) domain-containing protein
MENLAAGTLDGFDMDAALGRVGGDLDLLKEIARIFLDDCPRSLTELRDAAASNDCVVVERSAHALKGASANFGAARLVVAALRIEKMGHARTLDGFAPAMAEMESALDALCSELEALIAS